MPIKQHVIQQPMGTGTQPYHNAVRNRLVHLLSRCFFGKPTCTPRYAEAHRNRQKGMRAFSLQSCCIDCAAGLSHWTAVLSYPLMYGVQSIRVLISAQSGKKDADSLQGKKDSGVQCVQISSFVSLVICCLSCCVQLFNFVFSSYLDRKS